MFHESRDFGEFGEVKIDSFTVPRSCVLYKYSTV